MAKSNVLVIYHAECHDGFAGAWLFSHAFPEAEFHPAHYGTKPPDVTGKEVYIVDFSYGRSVLEVMRSMAKSIVLLDHHETAQKDLEPLTDPFNPNALRIDKSLRIVFDMTKSGARLAWEYLWATHYSLKYSSLIDLESNKTLDRDHAPWLVDYTEDRDLWRWQLPDSREINTSLRSYPLNFATWDILYHRGKSVTDRQKMVIEGLGILRREQQIIQSHIWFAGEVDIAGHKVLAVNATVLTSEIAGELAKGRPFGACWFDRFDGKRVWSLRSDENGIDVSAVAKQFGGGGHRRAAGYEV